MISEQEKHRVVQAMNKYGGGFISRLAHALSKADWVNTAKIKATWPEEWEEYGKIGRKMEDR